MQKCTLNLAIGKVHPNPKQTETNHSEPSNSLHLSCRRLILSFANRPHFGHSVPLGHFPKADLRKRRGTFCQIRASRPWPLFAILDQTRLAMTPRLRGRSGQFAYLVQRRSPDSP